MGLYYSYHCEEFTGIPLEVIESSNTFPTAFQQFKDWCEKSEYYALCAWRIKDTKILTKECRRNKINLEKWMYTSNDIQKQVTKIIQSKKILIKGHRVGLKKAMNHFNIVNLGRFHDGLSDARGAAMVMIKVFNQFTLYANTKEQLKRKDNQGNQQKNKKAS